MRASRFPDPRTATEDGIVAVGGDLEVATLIDAYSHGIFPWPQEGLPMLWFSPLERGWIDLSKEIPVPTRFARTFEKWKREGRVEVRIDTKFEDVIRRCQVSKRKGQDGTWILPEMVAAYERLFSQGLAHSVETFIDGELAGGLYGVFVNGVFSGESMFHVVPDAGKVSLLTVLQMLKAAGFEFADVQMVTPIVASFGGELILRDDYLNRLELAQKRWDRKECRFEWVPGPVSLSPIR
jgi:leucyl/phenylalanyl-tRNA---protein transferase